MSSVSEISAELQNSQFEITFSRDEQVMNEHLFLCRPLYLAEEQRLRDHCGLQLGS